MWFIEEFRVVSFSFSSLIMVQLLNLAVHEENTVKMKKTKQFVVVVFGKKTDFHLTNASPEFHRVQLPFHWAYQVQRIVQIYRKYFFRVHGKVTRFFVFKI